MDHPKRNIWGLTIIQPWAAAIAHGPKRIENRKWKPTNRVLGEFLAIHAGKQVDTSMNTEHFIWDKQECTFGKDAIVTSAIIAVAVIDGFVKESPDPWFFGPWGWVLRDVVAIEPVPCSGKQGLWTLPPHVYEAVQSNYRFALAIAEAKP